MRYPNSRHHFHGGCEYKGIYFLEMKPFGRHTRKVFGGKFFEPSAANFSVATAVQMFAVVEGTTSAGITRDGLG